MTQAARPEVAVLHNALDLLEQLARADNAARDLSVAEISHGADITRSAAYRILNTLEARGWVVEGPTSGRTGRRFRLGPAANALAGQARDSRDIIAAAQPILERLWHEFGETVNLGVRNLDEIVYVSILESDQGLRTSVEVGSRHPLHATALGKALLAAMPRSEAREILQRTDRVRLTPSTLVDIEDILRACDATRTAGFALDDEENEPGARCVAAAITSGGEPVAAISVSAPSWRMPDAVVERIGTRLRHEVDRLDRTG